MKPTDRVKRPSPITNSNYDALRHYIDEEISKTYDGDTVYVPSCRMWLNEGVLEAAINKLANEGWSVKVNKDSDTSWIVLTPR